MTIYFSAFGRDYWGWCNPNGYHREDSHPALNIHGTKYCYINGEAE